MANENQVPDETRPTTTTTGLSSEAKWVIGAIVAAIITIGIAALVVSVTVLQFSRIAADMRNQEQRTNASTSEVILELQMLVDRMRDDYRDRMHGVEDVLHELQQIRRRLSDGNESSETRRSELERALSNLQQTLNAMMLFRPASTSDLTQSLEEIRDELQAITGGLDATEEPEGLGGDGPANDEDPGRR